MDLLEKCKRVSKFGELNSNYIPDLNKELQLQLKEEVTFNTGPKSLVVDERMKVRYEDRCKEIFYISDIHLDEHIAKYCKSDKDILKYIEKVVDNLIDSLNEKKYGDRIIIFLGDVASTFEIAEFFYSLFMSKLYEKGVWRQREGVAIPCGITNYVYAILGNHEFWSFNNKENCYKGYEKLFNDLGIIFLNNSFEYLGKMQMNGYNSNLIIVGGTGFAGNGKVFTADNGLYRNALNREEEKLETKKWLKIYKEALKFATENKCNLIVATHNPLEDWYGKKEILQGTYLYGHTHKIYRCLDEKKDSFIFADNQIGYANTNITFKRLNVYNRINPFASYKDGYYEISIKQYLMFNDYILEQIYGTSFIEKHLMTGKFYMVKHNDYYGFFVVDEKGSVYICVGGKVKKIRIKSSIEEIYRDFFKMFNTILNMFLPYRQFQERLSEEIKRIGGIGSIHGLIVDIDFYNHIMINTDGNITYYYSPSFGSIYPYSSLYNLLNSKHNKDNLGIQKMIEKYDKLVKISTSLIIRKNSNLYGLEEGKYHCIDIKNSPYSISMRYNQIQRIFDKNVLRIWSDDVLYNNKNNNLLELPKKFVCIENPF